jgi:hypothetical protein
MAEVALKPAARRAETMREVTAWDCFKVDRNWPGFWFMESAGAGGGRGEWGIGSRQSSDRRTRHLPIPYSPLPIPLP